MRTLGKMTFVQFKLYLREPMSTFFTVAFAPLVLLLFGFIYGNKPVAEFGGRGTMDIMVPAYTAMIISTVGLMSVPIATSAQREAGVLRRYRATPLPPLFYLIADVAVYFVMTLLGILILVILGRLVYNVKPSGNVFSVFGGLVLGSFAFFALGYVLAALAPTARVAQIVGLVLLYPMMFLSGATIPLEVLPQSVTNVSRFIPLTYVVTLIRGLWVGESWGQHLTAVAVLLGMLAVGVVVSARLFRWE